MLRAEKMKAIPLKTHLREDVMRLTVDVSNIGVRRDFQFHRSHVYLKTEAMKQMKA